MKKRFLFLGFLALFLTIPAAAFQTPQGAVIRETNAASVTAQAPIVVRQTEIVRVAFFDGVIAHSARDGVVYFNEINTGNALGAFNFNPDPFISTIAYNADGSRLAVGTTEFTRGLFHVVDLQSNTKLAEFSTGNETMVNTAAFSPDGQLVVAGGVDLSSLRGFLRVWDVTTRELKFDLDAGALNVESIVYSPDGQSIVAGSLDGTVWIWDAATGVLRTSVVLGENGESVVALAMNPQSTRIAAATIYGQLALIDPENGAIFAKYTLESPFHALAFNVFGDVLVGGAENGKLLLMNGDGEVLNTLESHTEPIIAVSFLDNGRSLVSASLDRTAVVYSAPPGNTPPILMPIDDQTCEQNSELHIPIVVTEFDDEDTVQVQVEIANETVVQLTDAVQTEIVLGCGEILDSSQITVNVSDENGEISSTSFIVTVQESNRAPEFAAVETQMCGISERVFVNLGGADPEGGTLTITVSVEPSEALSVERSTSAQLVMVCGERPQTARVTVEAVDEAGLTNIVVFDVVIADEVVGISPTEETIVPSPSATTEVVAQATASTPEPIQIAPIADQNCTVSEQKAVPLSITGEMSMVTAASSNLSVVVVDNADNTSITLSCLAAGAVTVSVRASNAMGEQATQVFQVTVNPLPTPTNAAPILEPLSDQTCEIGQRLTISLIISDEQPELVAFDVISDSPTIASIIPANAAFDVICGPEAGTATLAVRLIDGVGAETSQTFQVTTMALPTPTHDIVPTEEAVATNQPPTIEAITNQTCAVGDEFDLELAFSDPDYRSLQLEVILSDERPVLVEQTSATQLHFRCASDGLVTITLTVSDDQAATASTSFTVQVGELAVASAQEEAGDSFSVPIIVVLIVIGFLGAIGIGWFVLSRMKPKTPIQGQLASEYYPVVQALMSHYELDEYERHYRELLGKLREIELKLPETERISESLPSFVLKPTRIVWGTTESYERDQPLRRLQAHVPNVEVLGELRPVVQIAETITRLTSDFVKGKVSLLENMTLDTCQPKTLPDAKLRKAVDLYLKELATFRRFFGEMFTLLPALLNQPIKEVLDDLHRIMLQGYVERGTITQAQMYELLQQIDLYNGGQGERPNASIIVQQALGVEHPSSEAFSQLLERVLRRIESLQGIQKNADVHTLFVANGIALLALRTLSSYLWTLFAKDETICLTQDMPSSRQEAVTWFIHNAMQGAIPLVKMFWEVGNLRLASLSADNTIITIAFGCDCTGQKMIDPEATTLEEIY